LPWVPAVLIALLAGCADHEPWVWLHNWTPDSDVRTTPNPQDDNRQCIAQFDPAALPQFDATHQYPTAEHAGKSEVKACMEGKGWSKLGHLLFP